MILFRIGKFGLSDNIVRDMKQHLNKKKIIKVKLLKSFLIEKTKQQCIEMLLNATNTELVESRGFVVTIKKV